MISGALRLEVVVPSACKQDADGLISKADQVSAFLRLLANEKRLLILARLMDRREMSVNDLAKSVDLSQSAISQHLAKLRREGLVDTRRASQGVYYRLSKDVRNRLFLPVLTRLFHF
jgi:ArsR family transcriptional regulator